MISKIPKKIIEEAERFSVLNHARVSFNSKKPGRAIEKLIDYDFVNLKYKYQYRNFNSFIKDFYDAFNFASINENKEAEIKLIETFIKLFISNINDEDRSISPEKLHSALVYRDLSSFYISVLKELGAENFWGNVSISSDTKKLYSNLFKSRLANFYRRNGEFKKAFNLLEECVNELANSIPPSQISLVGLSRIEYDFGYINFLKGNIKRSLASFKRSIKYAEKAKNETSKWMSICVKDRVEIILKGKKSKKYIKNLNNALVIFKQNIHSNPNADRWVKNVYAHLFEIFFLKKNIEMSSFYYQKIIEDRWVATLAPTNFSCIYEAKLFFLKEQYNEVVNAYQFLPQTKSELKTKLDEARTSGGYNSYEGISEHYLYFGQSHDFLGHSEKAIQVWEIGLECPPLYGNHVWQEKIRNKYKAKKRTLQ